MDRTDEKFNVHFYVQPDVVGCLGGAIGSAESQVFVALLDPGLEFVSVLLGYKIVSTTRASKPVLDWCAR